MLSVVIANFNNEKYVTECLDSVIEQTYKDLEIVICDDGSTDGSSKIINEYKKRYPKIVKTIFNSVNRGAARAIHKAVMRAEGEYITTLDSDDYYCHGKKLEKEMKLIQEYKKKEEDIIPFSDIIIVDKEGKEIGPQWPEEKIWEGNLLEGIISRSCMIPRDFIVKRSVYFDVGGYDFHFPIYEDWDLKIRLAINNKFYYTGINGTAYRIHKTGLSSRPIPQHIKWLNKIFKKNFFLVDMNKKREIKKQFKVFKKTLKKSKGKK